MDANQLARQWMHRNWEEDQAENDARLSGLWKQAAAINLETGPKTEL